MRQPQQSEFVINYYSALTVKEISTRNELFLLKGIIALLCPSFNHQEVSY